MGIHQLPKAYPQRTIQSAVIILYHYPTCKSTVPFIYLFSFLRIIAYCVPLSVSLRTGFSQNENIISWLIYQYCMKGIYCCHFFHRSLLQLGVWMSEIGPNTYKQSYLVVRIFLTTAWQSHCHLRAIVEEADVNHCICLCFS